MALIQTRRGFLGGVAAASATGLIRASPAEAADGPLETTTVRIREPGLCVSSLYIAEEMLRAEGFTEIHYIEEGRVPIRPITQGEVDFSPAYAPLCVRAIDAGEPIMVLSGVMVGCFELFAREGIVSVAELKGKSIGVGGEGAIGGSRTLRSALRQCLYGGGLSANFLAARSRLNDRHLAVTSPLAARAPPQRRSGR
jgi:NitT/TauT family transport system substrate-binding protein